MNDEIREILDKLKDTADTSFFAVCGSQEELDKMPKSITKILSIPSKDAKILLDYITNLQQENERLKENNQSYQKEMARTWKIADDYKSRVEKAIEYINKYDNIKAYYEYVECGYDEYNYDDDFKEYLLNILQNGSDEE